MAAAAVAYLAYRVGKVVWNHSMYLYYSWHCPKVGIKKACAVNPPNQGQEDLERMVQEANKLGVSSVSALRFKVGYANNPYCRQQLHYSGKVWSNAFKSAFSKR